MIDAAPRRWEAWVLYALGLGAALAFRWGLGLGGAMGTDAPLWGLTGVDLLRGAAPLVPPLYPAAVGLLWAAGAPLVDAGWVVATLGWAAVPPAVAWAARGAGASAGAARVAAALCLLLPAGLAWAQQSQPDSLTALAAVALGGLLARAQGSDAAARRAAWAAAILAGLLPLLREHGLPLAGLTALALLASPLRPWGALAALAGLVMLGPSLANQPLGTPPWRASWSDRAGGALAVILHPDPDAAPYARTLPRGPRQVYFGLLAERDRLGLIAFHAARSLHTTIFGWALAAAAGLGALLRRDRRHLALAAPLLAALPALLIWSQARHVEVLVPLALAALAAAWPQASRAARGSGAGLALALLVFELRGLPTVGSALRTELPRAQSYQEVAGWLETHATAPALLGGIFQDVGLYHPLPRHDPDGSAADWRTWLVADRAPRDPRWEPVFHGARGLTVYQFLPRTAPRPCADAAVAPGTPSLTPGAATARLLAGSAPCAPPTDSPRAPPAE